ncbi:NACHT domain-containing protein [Micromonospora sp. LOL_013]|uniref:NACHT domain-containing protein n=1 Tax=Micromonospora sp. LOL_013 TaxID=3345414 RepID=UPI003A89E2C6
MDPVLSGALGNALGEMMFRVAAVSFGQLTALPDPDISLGHTLLGDSGDQVLISDDQATELNSFIASPEVSALVQNHLLISGLVGRHKYAETWLDEVRDSFDSLLIASINNIPQVQNIADIVWRLVLANAEAVAPPEEGLAQLPVKHLESLMSHERGLKSTKEPPAPRYIRLIIESTRTLEQISEMRTLCADICRSAAEATSQMSLQHSQDHHRFPLADLYIERTLTPVVQRTDRRIIDLTRHPAPGVALVILGAPGAGKSTLINRLVNVLATRAELDFFPVVVPCKTLNVDQELAPILSYVTRSANILPGVSANTDVIERLVALGRAVLVFDGIDEVVDISRRRALIDVIERMAIAYPLASIVCTTRKVGYESAQFQSPRFEIVELEEFDESQVQDYAQRWFTLMKQSSQDCVAFLDESEEIAEIRRNPLMLSLLCALYRVRGYIPMNRLDVYKSCADLLFYSWDAMRHIPQPVDHRRYGHGLMQELADLFFKFPTTSGGVEEGQLTRLIATYFRDTAGVESAEAERRASEFLQFCAGRAWLLTATGTSARGQRLFAFTHRTFMEFYAAEAIVRRARTVDEVLSVIIDVYSKNASSVLPDLLVEAYDEKSYRGAEEILRALMRAGREGRRFRAGSQLALCLRILNSTPVGAPLVREVLVEVFRVWRESDPDADYASLVAMLSLDPPTRFVLSSVE